LTATGDSANDTITFDSTLSGGQYYVTVNAVNFGVLASAITLIDVDGGTGNDTIDLQNVSSVRFTSLTSTELLDGDGDDLIYGSALHDEIRTGDGTDTVYAGNGDDELADEDGNDTFYGEDGNDVLNAFGSDSGGNDTFYGGSGNDTLYGEQGSDTLDGGSGDDSYVFHTWAQSRIQTIVEGSGSGTDTLDFSNFTTGLNMALGIGLSQPIDSYLGVTLSGSANNLENLYGGSGNDSLYGNTLNNVIKGNGGNDTLGGETYSFLGSGSDTLEGGNGDDTYVFAESTSTHSATIVEGSSAGTDTLDFSSFSADVNVALGIAFGQPVGSYFSVTLSGSAYNIENLNGGSGNDSLYGNTLNNVIKGNGGNDTLGGETYAFLGSGSDTLEGGGGDDTYFFAESTSTHSATIVEGSSAGTDTLDFSNFTADVNVALGIAFGQPVGSYFSVTLSGSAYNIENLYGGSGDDSLYGNTLNNVIKGNDGNDTLGGETYAFLGSGSDTLEGGNGDDTYSFAASTSTRSATIVEGASAGTDTVDFSAFSTAVTASLNTTSGQSVDAYLTLTLSSTSTFENLFGGSGNDTLTGNALDNHLKGNDGDDTIYGLDGDDILDGGPGTDTLDGGSGSNTYL
jgi:Ca2+-binding RTX toxin-like protein